MAVDAIVEAEADYDGNITLKFFAGDKSARITMDTDGAEQLVGVLSRALAAAKDARTSRKAS